MRAQTGTSIAARAKNNVSFSEIINSPTNRALLEKTLNDPGRVTRLVATLIAAVSRSDKLKNCKPETIISAALDAESMNLSLPLKQFSLVPYGQVCTLNISAAGYMQLAIRTGLYKSLGAFEIREGEYQGRDALTGQPIIKFVSDDNKRERLPVIGHYVYFVLNNGFRDSIYWSLDKLLDYANTYSPNFDLSLYKKYKIGAKLSEDEQRQVDNGPWYGKISDLTQDAMCQKTLMKKLLTSGKAPLSVDLIHALAKDEETLDTSNNEEFIDIENPVESTPDTNNAIDAEIVAEPKSKSKRNEISVRDAFFGGKENDDNSAE